MNADELRATQAPLKDPLSAPNRRPPAITLKASGALDSAAIACKVETGRVIAAAGLHPATGGSGAELCSGDMLLEALVACAGVTLKAVADRAGRRIALGTRARRGRSRLPRHARRGERRAGRLFRHPTAVSNSTRTRRRSELDTLLKLTERYCVVLQTLRRPPAIEASIAH